MEEKFHLCLCLSVQQSPGISKIERTDGKSATIGAYALPGQRSQVLKDFRDNFLPMWEAKYNDVSWSFSGEAEGEDQFLIEIRFLSLVALLAMFALLSIAF